MAAQDPTDTTLRDLCNEALKDCGYLGIGQTADSASINDAWTRCQWMLQEWERKRWLVYVLQTWSITSTGAQSYTIGPGGDIDTGTNSVRPARIESAFLRQINIPAPNQIDYPLEILQSREDYNKIALKSLQSFPGTIFLQTDWPLGRLFCYPVPQASIYAVHVSVMSQLQSQFANLSDVIVLPYEYYSAIMSNLALRLRSRYQIGTYPGDELPNIAASSLKTLRGANTQIARLELPNLNRSFLYDIFSDRFY